MDGAVRRGAGPKRGGRMPTSGGSTPLGATNQENPSERTGSLIGKPLGESNRERCRERKRARGAGMPSPAAWRALRSFSFRHAERSEACRRPPHGGHFNHFPFGTPSAARHAPRSADAALEDEGRMPESGRMRGEARTAHLHRSHPQRRIDSASAQLRPLRGAAPPAIGCRVLRPL